MPRLRISRAARLLSLGVALASLACGEVKSMVQLMTALSSRYELPVTVNASGSEVTVTFTNVADSVVAPDSAHRYVFARGVASFVKKHYANAGTLRDIKVEFATSTRTGPLTVSRNDTAYTFATRDLP